MAMYPDAGAISVSLTSHEKSPNEPMTPMEYAIADTFSTFTNYFNFYYTAPIYLTSTLLKFDLLYDTGSPEMTLGLATCTGCLGSLFSPGGSFVDTGEARTITYYDGT